METGTMSRAKPIAFVIMPFAEEFYAGFADVIRPAVKRAGLECVRADQEPLGHIHRTMFERIFDSRARTSVLYEYYPSAVDSLTDS